MNNERLKQGGNRYFRELLQRILNIRGSERNFNQQVTDIYATATDYDSHNEMTKMFFATVQNKLHYAVHENALGLQFILNILTHRKGVASKTLFRYNPFIFKG